MKATATLSELAELATTRGVTEGEYNSAMALAVNTAARFRAGPECQGIDWDDLLQESRLAAWKALLLFDPKKGARLEPWIITKCRSAIQDALRRADPLTRAQRRMERERERNHPESGALYTTLSFEALAWNGDDMTDDDGLPILGGLTAEDWQIDDLTEEASARVIAGQALLSLAEPRERRVVELVGMAGETVKEAARTLGLSYSTCHLVWERAKARMRAAIGGML